MDLLTVLRILGRRWMVLVPALLLTVVTAGLLSTIDGATYGASASVLVRPSETVTEEGAFTGEADPLLQPAAADLATLLSEQMDQGGGAASTEAAPDEAVGDAAGEEAEAAGAPAESEVATGSEGAADAEAAEADVELSIAADEAFPLIRVRAVSSDRESVIDTVGAVSGNATAEMRRQHVTGEATVPPSVSVRQLAPASVVRSADGVFTAEATLLLGSEAGAEFRDYTFVSQVLQERLRDDAVRADLAAAGASAEMMVYPAEQASPILRVAASGPDADAALLTSQLATQTLRDELDTLQEDFAVPDAFRTTLVVLAYPDRAQVLESNTMRVVLAVVGLGVLASIGLVLMVDASLASRSRRAAGATTRGELDRTALELEEDALPRETALSGEPPQR